MLRDETLSKINLMNLQKTIRSKKYKIYAHNLKFFKEYKHEDSLLIKGDSTEEDQNELIEMEKQSDKTKTDEMRNRFEKYQKIDNIRNKRTQEEKLMFGADTLEVIYDKHFKENSILNSTKQSTT